jgi:hypothetical protein
MINLTCVFFHQPKQNAIREGVAASESAGSLIEVRELFKIHDWFIWHCSRSVNQFFLHFSISFAYSISLFLFLSSGHHWFWSTLQTYFHQGLSIHNRSDLRTLHLSANNLIFFNAPTALYF